MITPDTDDVQLLIDYRDGFIRSKAMFTACELGVFDLLLDIKEPMSAASIANHLGTDVDATDSLLSACVGLKLLKAEMKNKEAYYSNTEVSSTYLGKNSPKSMYDMMIYYSHTTYSCFQYLLKAIREGRNQCGEVLGTPYTSPYETLCRSEEILVSFLRCMDCSLTLFGKDAIEAFDLSEFHIVYDIGGCSGALAKMFLSTYPGTTITVMDLPKVVQFAKKYTVTANDQRISFLEGDFFNDPIPEADLYILSRIIHNWPEDRCLYLLRKINQSCRPGGAVLIVEALLNEDKSGPLNSQIMSLIMLLNMEGKERSPLEYTKLLNDAGFSDVQFKASGKSDLAILARK